MATRTADRPSPRERLLAAANELFYEEGVHSVGIERVIERAGVARASLYNTFGSKDALVGAYLRGRHASIRERMDTALATRYDSPRARLLGVFEVQGETFGRPGYRGCAFVRSNAETRAGSKAEEATAEFRAWLRSLFRDLAAEAGAADPDGLARQLVLLYDGAAVAAWVDHEPEAALAARSVATRVIDAALP